MKSLTILADNFDDGEDDAPTRPQTRADCAQQPRPCPWISCRYHLLLDVSENGQLRYRDALGRSRFDVGAGTHLGHLGGGRRPTIEEEAARVAEMIPLMPETCALDVADHRDPATMEEIATLLGISRQRVEQHEYQAFLKIEQVRQTFGFPAGPRPKRER